MKRVSFVGLGYIGLPTAILAAQSGYEVYGFDVNLEKIQRINLGDATIVETGIKDALLSVLHDGSFRAHSKLQQADYFVIAVPTPFKDEHQADLTYVWEAAKSVAQQLVPGNVVILESTVPVGATAKMAQMLEELSGLVAGSDFYVAHCPERVLPGRIFEELVQNDRVIGGCSQESAQKAAEFYTPFVQGQLYLTDDKSAEMVKLVENSCRDVQIAFANQVAAMCTTAGINPFEVINLANKHPRVDILQPGCGVGGHCIAVDPFFLIETFPQDTALLKAARQVNDNKPFIVMNEIREKLKRAAEMPGKTGLPKVALLGLTYKPNVDDLRESPALKIAQQLVQATDLCEVMVCEPNVKSEHLGQLGFNHVMGLWQAVATADLIVILVKHKEFKQIAACDLQNKFIVDPCGLLQTAESLQTSRPVVQTYTTRATAFVEINV